MANLIRYKGKLYKEIVSTKKRFVDRDDPRELEYNEYANMLNTDEYMRKIKQAVDDAYEIAIQESMRDKDPEMCLAHFDEYMQDFFKTLEVDMR